MEKIDWDKAPEWADSVGFAGISKHAIWVGRNQYQYCDSGLTHQIDDSGITGWKLCEITITAKRPSPAWSGEGLPPAGTVCEYNASSKRESGKELWCEVVIKYLSEWVVVFECTKAPLGHEGSVGVELFGDITDGMKNRFRPIRTPEQIATDEREAAIDQLTLLIDSDRGKQWRLIAEAIYDAGYRKP